MKNQIEIERKYIIKMPSVERMTEMEAYASDVIVQVYLPSKSGETHRVRSRSGVSGIKYTETKKIRIDKMSVVEKEREISEEEFLMLSSSPRENTKPIEKTRHSFVFEGQVFEIDVYPYWKNTAIMETELSSREDKVRMPDLIEIVREVTGRFEYSNSAMSEHFPEEDYL